MASSGSWKLYLQPKKVVKDENVAEDRVVR